MIYIPSVLVHINGFVPHQPDSRHLCGKLTRLGPPGTEPGRSQLQAEEMIGTAPFLSPLGMYIYIYTQPPTPPLDALHNNMLSLVNSYSMRCLPALLCSEGIY